MKFTNFTYQCGAVRGEGRRRQQKKGRESKGKKMGGSLKEPIVKSSLKFFLKERLSDAVLPNDSSSIPPYLLCWLKQGFGYTGSFDEIH